MKHICRKVLVIAQVESGNQKSWSVKTPQAEDTKGRDTKTEVKCRWTENENGNIYQISNFLKIAVNKLV